MRDGTVASTSTGLQILRDLLRILEVSLLHLPADDDECHLLRLQRDTLAGWVALREGYKTYWAWDADDPDAEPWPAWINPKTFWDFYDSHPSDTPLPDPAPNTRPVGVESEVSVIIDLVARLLELHPEEDHSGDYLHSLAALLRLDERDFEYPRRGPQSSTIQS